MLVPRLLRLCWLALELIAYSYNLKTFFLQCMQFFYSTVVICKHGWGWSAVYIYMLESSWTGDNCTTLDNLALHIHCEPHCPCFLVSWCSTCMLRMTVYFTGYRNKLQWTLTNPNTLGPALVQILKVSIGLAKYQGVR